MGTLRAIVIQHAGSSPIPVYPPNDVSGDYLCLTIYFVTKLDTVGGRVHVEYIYPSINWLEENLTSSGVGAEIG